MTHMCCLPEVSWRGSGCMSSISFPLSSMDLIGLLQCSDELSNHCSLLRLASLCFLDDEDLLQR